MGGWGKKGGGGGGGDPVSDLGVELEVEMRALAEERKGVGGLSSVHGGMRGQEQCAGGV